MTNIFCIILFLSSFTALGQTKPVISIYDFVKIKNGKYREAIYYYENNWKFYRDIALKKNYISSYRLVSTMTDTLADFDLILITEYADSADHKMSEKRFSEIIKETRPNGPLLLNELKPEAFRQNLYYRKAETVFSSAN